MGLSTHIMAIDRVQQRLRKVAAALESAGIRYAVVGGNAVAAWVSRVDPGATRATKDVDLLVRRADVPEITRAITALGFTREDLRDITLFVDPDEPSKKSGVHLVWAGEKLRPSYAERSPTVDESERDPEGFWVVSIAALVRMKLTSFRPVDQVHLIDMIDVGLLDAPLRLSLPPALRERLEELERRHIDNQNDSNA
jgi:hypothetical protein